MPDIVPLSNIVRLATHRLTRRLHQVHSEGDLTLTQVSALTVIWQDGPIPAGDLAAREQVRPPSITRVVDTLERLGMAKRTGNPADGRQILIEITPLGSRTLQQNANARQEWLAQQLIALSAADRTVLGQAAEIINRMARSPEGLTA